jgi:hypothetical protein
VSRLPRPFLNRETWWDFGNHGKYIIVCELFAAFRTAAVHHHGSGQFEETERGTRTTWIFRSLSKQRYAARCDAFKLWGGNPRECEPKLQDVSCER